MNEKELELEGMSRRGIIMGALYGIPLLIGGTFTASVGKYLLGRQTTTPKDSWADAGDISDIPGGTPCQVRFERAVADGWKVRSEQSSAWVILDDSGKLRRSRHFAHILGVLTAGRPKKSSSPAHATVRHSMFKVT